MDNLKPFDPQDIDESLLKIVMHGGQHYALFPYVDALGAAPEYRSVRHQIGRDTISVRELDELSALIRRRGENALWFISFSTPWLISAAEVENLRQKSRAGLRKR